jgi:hypothetical protein
MNFWPNFDISNFWLKKFIKQHNLILNNIVIYSLFGNKSDILNSLQNKQASRKTILYSFENFDNYSWIKPYLQVFDLVLGLNHININNYIRVPSYFRRFYIDKKNIQTIQKFKTKNICLVSRNPHELRLNLVNKISNKNMIVDCGGPLLNNIGYNIGYKIDFLSDYYFNICPENSWSSGYCTEKIYDALLSNCIPIYWGDYDLDKDVINHNKILYINQDLSNIDYIVDKCISLIKNKDKLECLSNLEGINYEHLAKNINDIQNTLLQRLNNL